MWLLDESTELIKKMHGSRLQHPPLFWKTPGGGHSPGGDLSNGRSSAPAAFPACVAWIAHYRQQRRCLSECAQDGVR